MSSYTVIIAEKPSVAGGIAKLVGANTQHRKGQTGYVEGNGYRVTWAFGHLVGLDRPEDVGFPGTMLPIFPEEFKTHVIKPEKKDLAERNETQVKQLDVLFRNCDKIIVATDAGREGELIFRYIYEYVGSTKPFDRLWISSLTDEAIREGMQNLLPGSTMHNLSEAAHARSEADWLVGFNASRALRLASGFKGKISLGRVQTPVLCMVCNRYEANRNFVPTPYWQISALAHKDMTNITVLSERKYQTEAAAKEDMARVAASHQMRVTKVEKKQVTTKPPLLYDLTSLQRAANTRYGLTADQTLRIAQKLYEEKYLSYPRTGSRYISNDVFRTIPSLIAKVKGYGRFAEAAANLEGKRICKKSVDGSKVTDHHALLPTGNIPSGLTDDQQKIWEMVCGRMLEAFGEDSVSEKTNVSFESGGVPFKASGSVLVKAGWKAVFGVREADEEKKEGDEGDRDESDNGKLPPLREGEVLPAAKIEVVRKTDKPLPIYTDASLLGEMETCGKRIEDEELREAMKDVGLGTPATRAETIETLIARGYIERKSKKLLPLPLGIEIWKLVRDRKIADVKTTAEWEHELALIEQGKKSKEEFDRAIHAYVLEIIEDIQKNCSSFEGVSATGEPVRTCPICGAKMQNLKYSVSCDPARGGCGFKINREICHKKIPGVALETLALGRTTSLIKGFTSKNGNTFDAKLTVDREKRTVEFAFDRAPATEGRTCPVCGEPLRDDQWKLTCGCGFVLWKKTNGVVLTTEQIDGLLSGAKVTVKGMTSQKTGKKYDAKLHVNTETGKLEYEFINKKK